MNIENNELEKRGLKGIRQAMSKFIRKLRPESLETATPVSNEEISIINTSSPLLEETKRGNERFNPNPDVLKSHTNHTLDELKGIVNEKVTINLDGHLREIGIGPSEFFAGIIERYLVGGESLNRIYHSTQADISGPTFNKIIRALGVETLSKGEANRKRAIVQRGKKTEQAEIDNIEPTITSLNEPKSTEFTKEEDLQVKAREEIAIVEAITEITAPEKKSKKKKTTAQTFNAQGLPQEEKLQSDAERSAKFLMDTWEKINIRRVNAGQNIRIEDYRCFARTAEEVNDNVFRSAVAWSQSRESLRKQYSEIILFSQALIPVLASIDELMSKYPDSRLDIEDLIQEGIFETIVKFNKPRNVSKTLASLNRIAKEVIGGKIPTEQPIEISTLSFAQLDTAMFTTNTETFIDPHQEAERADVNNLLNQAISTLKPRNKRIIRKRYPLDFTPRATLEEIGEQEKVTRERIRRIESNALRKLRDYRKAVRYRDYDPNRREPMEFRNREEKEQESVRVYWNGVMNALYLGDTRRARHLIASLKVANLGIYSEEIKAKVIQLVEDPFYPTVSDQVIDDYLSRFIRDYQEIRTKLRELEQEDKPIPQQIQRMEELVKNVANSKTG